jgi:hypothetical protein
MATAPLSEKYREVFFRAERRVETNSADFVRVETSRKTIYMNHFRKLPELPKLVVSIGNF